MQILLSMRNQGYRTRNNSIFILNLFALQFISLIALNRLSDFYLKIAQLFLIVVDDNWSFSQLSVLVHLSFNVAVLILVVVIKIFRKFQYRESIIKLIGVIILNFKYIMLIPVGCINVKPLVNQDVSVGFKVICAFNMVITFVLSAAELYTNWSNRFIEKDYCNRRENSILCLFFQFGFVFSTIILGNLVGSLFLIAVSIFRAYQVSITVQYNLIQSSTFFYSCLNIYMCIIFLVGEDKLGFLEFTCKIIIGVVVSMQFSEAACNFINTYYGNSKNLYKLNKIFNSQKSQKENLEVEQENKSVNNFKDLIILSRIVLNRLKIVNFPKESNLEWHLWWQKYVLIIASHKIICVSEKCGCRKKIDCETQCNIVMEDMRKYMQKLQQEDKSIDVRIMGVYLNVEIINKPLKAYYQIIRMGGEEASVTNSVDLQCLLTETRQCFSRIFLIHNIQNSNLPLMKIIKFEELLESLEVQIKQVLEANVNFNDLFTLNSVKIIQVINQSKRIFDLKQKISDKFEDLIINYPDSFRVNFFIYIFYQYLEPYRSRQKQFKIISQQKNLKRRLFQKQDQDIFSPEHGVIYIDMVQERGKIKKITKNVCELFGHNYEDMVSFNINQFMPQIFSRHHHKFLSNFIEFGKIKILSEKKRLIFAKNKNKFIFPVYVRMKTEHLLHNEFGVTALIKKIDTTSQFIIFGQNGKIQQMTERVYKTVFFPCLKTEVDKTRRLCLLKMIPQIINVISEPNFQAKAQNIHESLLIFSSQPEMLQKFKTYKERQHESGYQSTNSFAASSELQQSTEVNSVNSTTSLVYYGQVFKAFLNDLNIVKLNAFQINYKISKLRTQEFSVFLLEIVSIQAAENTLIGAIDQYKKVSELLGIYEEYGGISQNFDKYKRIVQHSDVLNYVFNRNIASQNVHRYSRKNNERCGHRKKVITIMDDDQNKVQRPEIIPDDSQIGKFNDVAQINNQPELMQRGGSERSSITDQSQSQSKKQMLINAFNTDNIRVSTKLLLFINITVAVKLAVLLTFVIISIQSINKMYSEQLKNVMNLNIKQVFEYRLASNQIDTFYDLVKVRNYTIPQNQLTDLEQLKSKLNVKFTQTLVGLKKINQYTTSGKEEIYQLLSNYDPHLKSNTQITLIQLLNRLDFMFRSQTANIESDYFELNYVTIHNKFKQICTNDIKSALTQKLSNDLVSLAILALYQFLVVALGLLWIPILYFVSKEQKRIINLLSTMNVKELKRVTHKLRILLQNMKTNKMKEINEMLGLLNDEQLDNAIEMQKEKMTRNIRLVEEQGSYTVKPKIVAAFIFVFILIFSILPITVQVNLMLDDDGYHKVLRIMQETSMLADKVPILANVYVTNLNKVYNSLPIKQFPLSLYESAENQYFNLTELISQSDDISKNLVSKMGTNKKFSDHLCLQIQCSKQQKASQVKFYDQILLIRNSFSILGPSKLDLISKMTKQDIDKWINETSAIKMMGWVSKIYKFAYLWNNRFKQSIQNTLNNTQQRLIILASILLPVYIFTIIYVEMWLIKKMSKILKSAETIHMHFPVQILAENTYLTSYFNDKIKNSK